MRTRLFIAILVTAAVAGPALALKAPRVRPVAIDRLMQDGFKSAAPEWRARLVQDETQKACSTSRSGPSEQAAAVISKRARESIVYPPDGQFMGDWKKGEAIAQSGYGGRYTDVPPRQANGGNCYACHQLDKKEVSYGTLGPSLAEYGRIRKFGEPFAKAAYEHIYNPHASQPCANMPRFGASKFLSVEQIKDLVAYLMSPESPVNK